MGSRQTEDGAELMVTIHYCSDLITATIVRCALERNKTFCRRMYQKGHLNVDVPAKLMSQAYHSWSTSCGAFLVYTFIGPQFS